MWIVAFDPGETTGIAELDTESGHVHAVQTRNVSEIGAALNAARSRAESGENVLVLVENFVGGGYRTKAAIHTLKLLGLIEHFCTLFGLRVFVQPPQFRKAYVSKAKAVVGDSHAADAYAHILYFVATILKEDDTK
jgi:hypothetical protein